jgi:hypothetical protein
VIIVILTTAAHVLLDGARYDFGKDLVQVNIAMWAHGPVLGMTYAF